MTLSPMPGPTFVTPSCCSCVIDASRQHSYADTPNDSGTSPESSVLVERRSAVRMIAPAELGHDRETKVAGPQRTEIQLPLGLPLLAPESRVLVERARSLEAPGVAEHRDAADAGYVY